MDKQTAVKIDSTGFCAGSREFGAPFSRAAPAATWRKRDSGWEKWQGSGKV